MQRVLVAYVDNFIINDLQPFNSVENPSLREFCSTIQPRYAFPTSQEVQVRAHSDSLKSWPVSSRTDAFEARHATLSQAVDIVLSTICGTENFSASCCTHIVGNEQKFTKARIYWVGDNWALNRLTISTPSIMAGSEADTFRSIKDKFTAAGGDFASLVHCVASEITGAEKALADDEAIACVSVGPRSLKRTLDRAFEEGSKRGDVCALLSKVREHLLCIQSSPILLDMARSACEELNIPFSLDFVDTNDEETWLATMAMLDATVRSEKVFTMLYGREAISPQLHVLSDTDFELASQICGILQPLKTALEQLEAPNVSIGTLYVVSQSILRQLDQSTYVVVCTPGGSTEMAEASLLSAAAALRRRFRDGFARYWSRVTADASQLDVMHLAAALDARFKSLKSAPEAEQEKAWKTVKTKAQELDRATQDCDGGEMLEAKRQKRASSFFGDGAGNEFSETTLDDEIRRYKEFPQCSLSQDHLAWWAAHNRTYPRLAKVARKYLSVQIGGYQSATELADQDIKLRRLERLGHHVAQKVKKVQPWVSVRINTVSPSPTKLYPVGVRLVVITPHHHTTWYNTVRGVLAIPRHSDSAGTELLAPKIRPRPSEEWAIHFCDWRMAA
eukprot:scaffold1504_cov417-Prasinococcus_capsulatus_cf.AAC.41